MHRWWVKTHYVYTFIVTLFVLNIIFFLRLNQVSDKVVIQTLINIDLNLASRNLTAQNITETMMNGFSFSYAIMENPSEWVLYDGYLVMYIIQKFFFTALTLSCAVPGGIFTPTFAIGASFGQLYVSVLLKVLAFFQVPNSVI